MKSKSGIDFFSFAAFFLVALGEGRRPLFRKRIPLGRKSNAGLRGPFDPGSIGDASNLIPMLASDSASMGLPA